MSTSSEELDQENVSLIQKRKNKKSQSISQPILNSSDLIKLRKNQKNSLWVKILGQLSLGLQFVKHTWKQVSK